MLSPKAFARLLRGFFCLLGEMQVLTEIVAPGANKAQIKRCQAQAEACAQHLHLPKFPCAAQEYKFMYVPE